MPPKVLSEKEVQATLATAGGGAGAARPASAGGAAAPAKSASAANTAAKPASSGGSSASGGGARTLPKTATHRPLIGFGGAVSLLIGVVLAVRRRYVS